jgi:putative mRNA 3-end processing factor
VRRSPVELVQGEVRVRGSGLFLDARRRRPCGFVSHAHTDHLGRHDRTLATAATAALARHRLGDRARGEVVRLAYRTPFELGELTLELFPAGHVLGSAQIRVTPPSGPAVGYTGDLCLEPTATAERAEVMECDVLVLESTFGLPRYVFPPKEEVLAAVRRFVDEALDDGATPVLLGYSLGKAQEVLRHFGGLGYPCRAHPAIHAVNQVYEQQGVELPNVRELAPEGPGPGEVVVVPPQLARSAAMARVRRRRTAVLTGWALDGARWFRGVDAAFPLSDHADFPSLVRYAKASGARRVLTLHGHAEPLARALRREGLHADPLAPDAQMELFP